MDANASALLCLAVDPSFVVMKTDGVVVDAAFSADGDKVYLLVMPPIPKLTPELAAGAIEKPCSVVVCLESLDNARIFAHRNDRDVPVVSADSEIAARLRKRDSARSGRELVRQHVDALAGIAMPVVGL